MAVRLDFFYEKMLLHLKIIKKIICDVYSTVLNGEML
jgi:hypothetical protein